VDGTLTVTKAALLKVLDTVLYPNPNDPGDPGNPFGPYGPIGPLIRAALRDLLNPQPLPPLAQAGLFPDPWRSAWVARTVIDQVVAQYRSASVVPGTPLREGDEALETIRAHIREFVDDYCNTPGTGPRRWPLPRPFPLGVDPAQVNPIDLLAAGAQFQKAADSVPNGPLQGDFSGAADRLLETGMQRLEKSD